jgi:hypothetical protein
MRGLRIVLWTLVALVAGWWLAGCSPAPETPLADLALVADLISLPSVVMKPGNSEFTSGLAVWGSYQPGPRLRLTLTWTNWAGLTYHGSVEGCPILAWQPDGVSASQAGDQLQWSPTRDDRAELWAEYSPTCRSVVLAIGAGSGPAWVHTGLPPEGRVAIAGVTRIYIWGTP